MRSASITTHPNGPADPSRRRVIFTGVAGLAALALARWLQPLPAPPTAASGLSAEAADVMRGLVPALLDGALPAAAGERTAAIDATVGAIAVAIAGLQPVAQQELHALFALLAFAPVRVALAGIDEPWPRASLESAQAFLEHLRNSRWSQKRAAYDALHQLTMAAWYANARTWPAIGYSGPPDLS